jgi:L-asparaginase II
MSSNPLLVEVLRGQTVESGHRGAIAVIDAEGRLVLSLGDIERPIFARSAIKALQALPLVESGAADRYGLGDAELAMACASHNGEDDHAAMAQTTLHRLGLDAPALECGAHWPMREAAARALAGRGGAPSSLHNNCSGKHAGFLCFACNEGHDPAGYVKREHPTMRMVSESIASMTGLDLSKSDCGTDGCSIPTFAIPLRALAYGFARFGNGHGLGPIRAKSAVRLRKAVAAAPHFVAGTGRFDTALMSHFGERTFVKVGAEGVYCASFPDQGLGIALKCDDGSTRGAEVMMAALVRLFVPLNDSDLTALDPLLMPKLSNWNGIAVGSLRPAESLSAHYSRKS